MKNKMFGMSIKPSCSYCENSVIENTFAYCKKGKQLNGKKCKSFKYDPLMRVPKSASFKKTYTENDFKL